MTLGGGDSSTKNFKVKHFITGNVVNPTDLKIHDKNIDVCRGTLVTIEITDDTGTPTVTEQSGGITCTSAGCTIVDIQSKQRYRAISQDSEDKDKITIRVND